MRALPSRKRSLAATALFAFAALYAFPFYPELNNPNENVRVQMTAAIVFDGTFEISGPRERWGWVNDAACVQWSQDGTKQPCEGAMPRGDVRRYFSVKAPLTSLMGVPAYGLARLFGDDGSELRPSTLWLLRISASVLPMCLFFFFFHGWLGARVRSGFIRDTVFVATALGSVLLGYTYLFASHSTSAAAAFGGFALLYDAHVDPTKRSKRRAFLAGLLAAGATALEYPCFVVTFFVCLYALKALPFRRWLPFVFGALLPTFVVMLFQWSAYGNPLTPGHLFVENSAFRAGHESGFFGADAFHWDAAWRLLFDARLGLLPLTPVFVFAPLGALALLGTRGPSRQGALAALTACGALYFVICLMNNWDGGWSLGPRYLVVLVPFIAVASAIGLDRIANRRSVLGHTLALGTGAASLAIGGTLSVYYPHLPPEIDWPMAHLMPALAAADLAPHSFAELMGFSGLFTMAPLVLLGFGALGWATRWTRDGVVLLSAFAIAIWLVAAQLVLPPDPSPQVEQSVQFIQDRW